MITEQKSWQQSTGWQTLKSSNGSFKPGLVLIFGQRQVMEKNSLIDEIRSFYPAAILAGCSTAGEICDINVYDESLSIVAIEFQHTPFRLVSLQLNGISSYEAGKQLAQSLPEQDLSHVFVLSDGQKVNGTDLVKGFRDILPPGINVTGGLAGDGADFTKTVLIADNYATDSMVAAIGFYGQNIKIGYGSLGGWDPFGPERMVTRSDHNVLYELDGRPALELYKSYLGEHAAGLPATGLLFPLSMKIEGSENSLVRTILSINQDGGMVFAGDLPEGARIRLMKANFERLIDGAAGAAESSYVSLGENQPDLAILISCIGRKLVLKQRIEEEVEAVREVLGSNTVLTGFYSYGELAPFTQGDSCELHNQTMTITTFLEL
jgi:hypothetical protein